MFVFTGRVPDLFFGCLESTSSAHEDQPEKIDRQNTGRITIGSPGKPPGALKNPFLIRRYPFFVEKGDSADSGDLLKGQIEAFPCFVGSEKAGFYREFDREFTGKPTGK